MITANWWCFAPSLFGYQSKRGGAFVVSGVSVAWPHNQVSLGVRKFHNFCEFFLRASNGRVSTTAYFTYAGILISYHKYNTTQVNRDLQASGGDQQRPIRLRAAEEKQNAFQQLPVLL